MKQNKLNDKNKVGSIIIIMISFIGLIAFLTLLFPQIRRLILDLAIQIFHREPFSYENTLKLLLSFSLGGICFILFFDYCTLTSSGRLLVKEVKQEIKDCLFKIDFRVFIKPVLLMFGIYLLGIFTIIRANYLYMDDIRHSIDGHIEWYNWSRYVAFITSIFMHGDIKMTDISPLPQLLAILILSCSSVLLVFILGKGKITIVRLLASIPLGLSPFILECLSFKFSSPNMVLSILACIIPFLFIPRKKAFFFVSAVSLLVMCMTYQAASGIYPMISLVLCFQYWNNREKTSKEILSFLGIAAVAFCFSMLLFRFFFMKVVIEQESAHVSNAMLQVSQIISGTLNNIKNYTMTINNDLSIIWKIGIILIFLFFIIKSTYRSTQKKLLSFLVSIIFIVLSFVLSFGAYSVLAIPIYAPRALLSFGIFLAILCICIIDYKKTATLVVLILNWCFLVFAFSYGNALADQARYEKFRIGLLLHDLSTLYPDRNKEDILFHLKNSINYAPTVKNISKHNPIIERLVPKGLGDGVWGFDYCMEHYNFATKDNRNDGFDILDFPVVLDSYYHTIKSDGENFLVILKH